MNRPRSRHGHKYSKYILSMYMYEVCFKYVLYVLSNT